MISGAATPETCLLNSRYFYITLYKAYSDLKAESAKLYASYLWWIIEPILQMMVYYLVFGLLFQRNKPGYVPFLLVGLVVWRWWTAIIHEGANSLVRNQHLIRQVYLPKFIFPFVAVLTQSFKFAIVFTILLAFLWMYGYLPGVSYAALPLVFLSQLLLVSGVTLVLSSLYPYMPDLRLLVETALQLLFFVSGVFFGGGDIPAEYRLYFFLNPLARLLESYREILLFNSTPDFGALALIGLLGLLLMVLGLLFLIRNDRKYPKVIR